MTNRASAIERAIYMTQVVVTENKRDGFGVNEKVIEDIAGYIVKTLSEEHHYELEFDLAKDTVLATISYISSDKYGLVMAIHSEPGDASPLLQDFIQYQIDRT